MSRPQRRGRKQHVTNLQIPDRPVKAGHQGGLYQPLSHAEQERTHQLALRLLSELGMSQLTDSLQQLALDNGCYLNDQGRLCFPPDLVNHVINNSRKTFDLPGRDAEFDLQIGDARVHTGTGGAAPTIMDFETGKYRESTVADLYNIARIVDKQEHIHWFHRSIIARDADNILDLDINTTYACLAGTKKPIAVSYTDAQSVKAVLPMLDAIAGGPGKFRERPFCTAVCCHVVPPMRFATESCEALEAAILAGMPVLLVSAGQAGATAPAALPGAVAQACAETLAGLVLCYLLDPQCRVIFATWPFVSDLRTGSMSGGSGEQALLAAASAQMARYYDLPNSVPAGMTDSKLPDYQAGAEKAYTITLAAQAGASMIHECAGMSASLMGTALENYVLDNDTLGAILRTVRGMEVNDESLNYDTIAEVVLGEGHYLGHSQTLNRMKSDYLYPQTFNRASVNEWQENGCQSARDKAREKVVDILSNHYPDNIDADTDQYLREHYNILLAKELMQKQPSV